MKLRAKYSIIILAFTLVSLISLALSLGWLFSQASQGLIDVNENTIQIEFENRLASNSEFVSEQIALNLALPLFNYNFNMLKVLSDVALADDQIISIRIFDTANNFIEQSGFPDELKLDTNLIDQKTLLSIADQQTVYINDNQHFTYIEPIVMEDEVIGGVEIIFSRIGVQQDILLMRTYANEEHQKNIVTFVNLAVIVTIALLLFAIIGSYFATSLLVSPIQKMAAFAKEIGQGNKSEKIAVNTEDELGELAQIMNDMSQNLELRSHEINHLAYHDYLTDMPNRHLFLQMIDKWIDEKHAGDESFALILLDMDGFKQINDQHGHSVADQILIQFSTRLSQVLDTDNQQFDYKRKTPYFFARLASDQFVILVNILDKHDSTQLAERILEDFQRPYLIQELSLTVQASMGITLFPTDSVDASELIKNTDIALSEAKSSGRYCYKYFSKELGQQLKEKHELEDELRIAIANRQISVWYQPIFDLRTNELVGAEALVRWIHPIKGFISPVVFIPLAEETGQMNPLGQLILEIICKQLKDWKMILPENFHIAINISAMQLRQKDLIERIKEQLELYDINISNLHIEITETALIHRDPLVIKTLSELRNLNLPIWLDDFGTGYSSLSHLKDFPVSGVKIDQSFVSDLEKNKESKLVLAVINLARTLKLDLVAEGIETQSQYDFLAKNDCHYGQGYLMGRPVPHEEFESTFFKAK